MARSLVVFVLMACFLAVGGCCSRAFSQEVSEQAQVEKPVLTRLPNGLTVYILRDSRFPLVCTRLYVRTGSTNEKPAQAGISHLLEHMVFKGTAGHAKGGIAQAVEEHGGYVNAATSFDKTWYLTDMPAAHWRTGIDVVREMAFEALLDPDELETEKEVVISELKRGEDSAQRKLFEELQVAALHQTPYGRPIIGFEECIRSVTADDLRAYIRQWYQPQNMLLLVAGDIEPPAVLEYVQDKFGNLQNTHDLAVREPFDLLTAADGSEQSAVTRGNWNKVYLGIAWPVPGIADARSIELDLLAFLLGGDDTSLLTQKYRYELKMVDSISVDNVSMAEAGLFTVTAQLDADRVEEFWQMLIRDLAALSTASFTPRALDVARLNLEDGIERARETLNGLASFEGTVIFELGGQQGLDNLRFVQSTATLEQISELAKVWLDPARARIRVVAPEEATLPDFAMILQENWQVRKTEAAPAAASESFRREVVQLDGGCQLILLPDQTVPYISMQYMQRGGNSLLTPEQQGLAALSARMLTDGSGNKNKLAMDRWLAERAASLGANAGLETFSIAITGPSRFNEDFFQLMNEVLRLPRFEPGELVREVGEMKAALVRRRDQPLAWMFSQLNPFLFPGGQPYGYDALGSAESLDKFNVLDVKNFWQRQKTQPWVLAICGDFDRDAAIAFARTLPTATAIRFSFDKPAWGQARQLALTLPGRNQAHLMQVFPTVPLTSPEAPALMLLEAILSGQSGTLFTRLRDEQGLGYTVTAFNRAMPQTGFMAFYIGTEPDKVEQARTGFAEVIAEMKAQPLAPDLLKKGAEQLKGEYERGRQSLASRAGEAATNAVLDYPEDFNRLLNEQAAQVTPEQLQELVRKYFVDPYDVTLLP